MIPIRDYIAKLPPERQRHIAELAKKWAAVEAAGFRVGDAEEFLEMTPDEVRTMERAERESFFGLTDEEWDEVSLGRRVAYNGLGAHVWYDPETQMSPPVPPPGPAGVSRLPHGPAPICPSCHL